MKRLRMPPRHPSSLWSTRLVLAAITLLLVACGDGDITGPDEGFGTVIVSLRTVGVELDLDGYTIRIDGGSPQAVGVEGTIRLAKVPEGARTVTLDGAAVTCDPEDGPARQVVVPRFGDVYIHWTVVCTSKPIVFSSYPPGATSSVLYRMNLDGTGVKRLGTTRGYRPRWSPDGTMILFSSGPRLFVMEPDGSGMRAITDGGGGTWSRDGSRIAFNRFRGEWGMWGDVYTIGVDGQDLRRVHLPTSAHDLDWGPDGRIAFIEWYQAAEGSPFQSWLSVMNDDGTGVTRLYEEQAGESISRPAWSPDGTRIAFSAYFSQASAIFTVGPDGSALRRRSGPQTWEGGPRWFHDSRTLLFTNHLPELGSELRMGAYDAEASSPISHLSTGGFESDIRPGVLPPS